MLPASRNAGAFLVSEGTLKIQIGRVLSLDDIVDAHRLIEENKADGKIVVLVN